VAGGFTAIARSDVAWGILSTRGNGYTPDVVHIPSQYYPLILVLPCECVVHLYWLSTRRVLGKLITHLLEHGLIVENTGR
jgi:hypothetical protein